MKQKTAETFIFTGFFTIPTDSQCLTLQRLQHLLVQRLTAVRGSSLAMLKPAQNWDSLWHFRWEGVWGAVPRALPDPSILILPEPARDAVHWAGPGKQSTSKFWAPIIRFAFFFRQITAQKENQESQSGWCNLYLHLLYPIITTTAY